MRELTADLFISLDGFASGVHELSLIHIFPWLGPLKDSSTLNSIR